MAGAMAIKTVTEGVSEKFAKRNGRKKRLDVDSMIRERV